MMTFSSREVHTEPNLLSENGFRTVVNGRSMLPSLQPNASIWIKPLRVTRNKEAQASELRLGDIIVFFANEYKGFVCHRVVRYNSKWVWEASEFYGTCSRIPLDHIFGKIYAWEKEDGKKRILGMSSRFIGFFRCYRSIFARRARGWLRHSIVE